MKKLFTLFVALTAVMSLSAKKIYLAANSDWTSYDAVFFVHSWQNGVEGDADAKLALEEGEEFIFSAEIPDAHDRIIFVRAQGESESIPWDSENLWNKTADLEIPEDKDCFWLVGWDFGVWMQNGERPAVSIVGDFEGDATWGSGAHPMTKIDDLTASVTFNINKVDTFEMKVWVEGSYISENGEKKNEEFTNYLIHRDYNHSDKVNVVNDGKNFKLAVDVAGDYTFTWSYFTHTLVVTFPDTTTAVDEINTNAKAIKRIVNGQLVIEKNGVYVNALGQPIR